MRKRCSGQVLNLDNSILIFKDNTPKKINVLRAGGILVLQCFTAASFIVDMSNIFLALKHRFCSAEMDLIFCLFSFLPNHRSQGGTFVGCKSLFLHPAWVGAHRSWVMLWAQPSLFCGVQVPGSCKRVPTNVPHLPWCCKSVPFQEKIQVQNW